MQLEDEFGDIVAKARAGKDLTTTQLAGASGLRERDIAEIESYRLTPDDDAIARLAGSLGLDARKLSEIAHESWLPQPVDVSTDRLVVREVHAPFGAYGENAYVVGCSGSRQGAAVDPGGAVDQIERHLLANKLDLSMTTITHAHADHTGGLRELADRHPSVSVVCSSVDQESVMRGIGADWQPAQDGTKITLGELTVTPLATPGHTAGSVCYAVSGVCFVGDTLFAGSIGRPARDYARMLEAIRTRVLSLPEETVLLPGHGPATTVEEEKAHNPFF